MRRLAAAAGLLLVPVFGWAGESIHALLAKATPPPRLMAAAFDRNDNGKDKANAALTRELEAFGTGHAAPAVQDREAEAKKVQAMTQQEQIAWAMKQAEIQRQQQQAAGMPAVVASQQASAAQVSQLTRIFNAARAKYAPLEQAFDARVQAAQAESDAAVAACPQLSGGEASAPDPACLKRAADQRARALRAAGTDYLAKAGAVWFATRADLAKALQAREPQLAKDKASASDEIRRRAVLEEASNAAVVGELLQLDDTIVSRAGSAEAAARRPAL